MVWLETHKFEIIHFIETCQLIRADHLLCYFTTLPLRSCKCIKTQCLCIAHAGKISCSALHSQSKLVSSSLKTFMCKTSGLSLLAGPGGCKGIVSCQMVGFLVSSATKVTFWKTRWKQSKNTWDSLKFWNETISVNLMTNESSYLYVLSNTGALNCKGSLGRKYTVHFMFL